MEPKFNLEQRQWLSDLNSYTYAYTLNHSKEKNGDALEVLCWYLIDRLRQSPKPMNITVLSPTKGLSGLFLGYIDAACKRINAPFGRLDKQVFKVGDHHIYMNNNEDRFVSPSEVNFFVVHSILDFEGDHGELLDAYFPLCGERGQFIVTCDGY